MIATTLHSILPFEGRWRAKRDGRVIQNHPSTMLRMVPLPLVGRIV